MRYILSLIGLAVVALFVGLLTRSTHASQPASDARLAQIVAGWTNTYCKGNSGDDCAPGPGYQSPTCISVYQAFQGTVITVACENEGSNCIKIVHSPGKNVTCPGREKSNCNYTTVPCWESKGGPNAQCHFHKFPFSWIAGSCDCDNATQTTSWGSRTICS